MFIVAFFLCFFVLLLVVCALSLHSGIAGQALKAVVCGPAAAPANMHGLTDRGPAAGTEYSNVTAGLRDGRGVAHAAALRRSD